MGFGTRGGRKGGRIGRTNLYAPRPASCAAEKTLRGREGGAGQTFRRALAPTAIGAMPSALLSGGDEIGTGRCALESWNAAKRASRQNMDGRVLGRGLRAGVGAGHSIGGR